jgi:hypothetical protein
MFVNLNYIKSVLNLVYFKKNHISLKSGAILPEINPKRSQSMVINSIEESPKEVDQNESTNPVDQFNNISQPVSKTEKGSDNRPLSSSDITNSSTINKKN